jgi:fibronectin type 3 domain-containing protein
LNISRIDVYRLTEPNNSPSTISEEDFSSRSTLIATIPVNDSDFAGKKMTFTDPLNFAGQQTRIRYAIRFANAAGQKAGFSNFLLIAPTARVAEAPGNLTFKVSQNSVEIGWQQPNQNVDGSTPANILGFNIYRIDEKNNQKVLNSQPVTIGKFEDKTFEFEKNYTYFVRTISLGSNAEPVESADSNPVKVSPKDTFPPSAPSAVTIAAAPNAISIFFASNLETDVIGYRVYRSTDRNLPKSEWSLLTEELLTTNTFQDTSVESGKTYFYFLTAVDKFGNVSDSSDIVGETVP